MELPVLEIRGISKTFSETFSLKNINLTLSSGQVHVLVGENGSGKSCLMKTIYGVFQPDCGDIFLCGEKVCFPTVAHAKKAGIYYTMQDACLYGNLSVAENIYFESQSRRKTFSHADTIKVYSECAKLFSEFAIAIDPHISVSKLGFAGKQIVEIFKAFTSAAKVVIFDEPSSSLTICEREKLYNVISRMIEHGRAIIYISHKLEEILRIGHIVSVIRDGELIETIPVSKLEESDLSSLVMGSVQRERYPKVQHKHGRELLRVERLNSGILKDISFTLREGEILGITGLMGSGRSMLANCLFGNRRISDGDIYIKGSKAKIREPKDALGYGMALLPEERLEDAVFKHMSMLDNATISSLPRFTEAWRAISSDFMENMVRRYVRTFNIRPGNTKDLLSAYSGGNQQKVIVTRWVLAQLDIYLMDEPTRGVDLASRIDIYNAMNDLLARGSAILFISSEFEEILGMCDRILVLADGRITCDLPSSQASKELIMRYALM